MGVSVYCRVFSRNKDGELIDVSDSTIESFDSSSKDVSAITTGEYNFSKVSGIFNKGYPPELERFFESECYRYSEYSYGWLGIENLKLIDPDKIVVRDIRTVINWHELKSKHGFDETIALAKTVTLREFAGEEFIELINHCISMDVEIIVFYSH